VGPHRKKVIDGGYYGSWGEERMEIGMVENKGVGKGGWVHVEKILKVIGTIAIRENIFMLLCSQGLGFLGFYRQGFSLCYNSLIYVQGSNNSTRPNISGNQLRRLDRTLSLYYLITQVLESIFSSVVLGVTIAFRRLID
jgi:hypothetical protein